VRLLDLIPRRTYRALCLHGFAPKDSEQWQAAYGVLLRCHERLGVKPEHVSLDDVPGLSAETKSVESFEKWLNKTSFPMPSNLSAGAAVWIGPHFFRYRLLHTQAWGAISTGLGSPAYCNDGRPLTIDGGMFKFLCDATLHRSAFSVFNDMVVDAWSTVGFEYGYALTHDDPTGFCMGGLRSKLPAELNALRRRWAEFRDHTPEGCVYAAWMDRQQGTPVREITPGPRYRERLRDVFPLNYLVDTHLALPVGRNKLGEWIRQDAARGALSALADGLWCWSVPDAAIPSVRIALEPTGLLVVPEGR
jgi:hypothetical protein